MLDALIIHPNGQKKIYQGLAQEVTAIEPPLWAMMLTSFLRQKKWSVELWDMIALNHDVQDVIKEIDQFAPRLVVVAAYGQQPSASTQNMYGASLLCTALKQEFPRLKIILLGGHVSALPEQTLREEACDFIAIGEGPYTLHGLLSIPNMNEESELKTVPGLMFRSGEGMVKNAAAPNVPQEKMQAEFSSFCFDLLPMKNYRAHNWHAFGDLENRSPYASLYTSLGCPFRCSFCCINAPFGGPSFRYFDPHFMADEITKLHEVHGIKHLKISDEMFVLKEAHFLRLCELLGERKLSLNIWAYARVDTVRPHFLDKLKKAGVNWLCLGIESKSQFVRNGVDKGRFQESDIIKTVRQVQEHGIYVHANYIFGLPDDTLASMQSTLDMALELNTEMSNFYSAMAYPGSELYSTAVQNGWKLPETWAGYSQHAYETLPLPTKTLSAGEVLGFRDRAWKTYFTNPSYLRLLEKKFGASTALHVKEISAYELKRKYAV